MRHQSTILLKITFFKQIRSLFFFFIYMGVIVWGVWVTRDLFVMEDKLAGLVILLLFLSYFLLFMTLPALFYHIDYLKRNRKEEYEIGNEKIIRRKQGVETVFDCNEIDNVYLYLSPPEFRNDIIRVVAHDNYHFAKIVMKSGEVLYLTSLLYPSGIEKILNQYMKGVAYEREKRWWLSTLVSPNL